MATAAASPRHTIDAAPKARIVTLAKTTYAGINDSHLAELLAEREGIQVSRASVQRLLRAAGIKSPRRHTRARYRRRRERRPAAGMLVQLDGSPDDWFGTGERTTLQAAIDDATGDVLAAVFREQEDAAGYFEVLRAMLTTQGVRRSRRSAQRAAAGGGERHAGDRHRHLGA